jgi:hypothetical protein
MLGGTNAAAIRNADGAWEVLQFETAELVAAATYEISNLLRAQAGTDGAMAALLPAGARFVLLDRTLAPVDMSPDDIGLAFNWRFGPASRDIGHASYVAATHAFTGAGLRPYSPVRVRGTRTGGDLTITWTRRTRIGGDAWSAADVPLAEETERYEIDILDGITVKRTISATMPSAIYSTADQTADFGAPQSACTIRLYQLAAGYGRGTGRTAIV